MRTRSRQGSAVQRGGCQRQSDRPGEKKSEAHSSRACAVAAGLLVLLRLLLFGLEPLPFLLHRLFHLLLRLLVRLLVRPLPCVIATLKPCQQSGVVHPVFISLAPYLVCRLAFVISPDGFADQLSALPTVYMGCDRADVEQVYATAASP